MLAMFPRSHHSEVKHVINLHLKSPSMQNAGGQHDRDCQYIGDVTTFDVDMVVETDGKLGNLPVNWPKL